MSGNNESEKKTLQEPLIEPPKITISKSIHFELKQNNTLQRMNNQSAKMIDEEIDEEQDSSVDLSDEESDKEREKQINKELRKKKLEDNANKKMVVGTGYSMDVTQFFQFEKKKQLGSKQDEKSVFEQISGSRIAWLILLYSVTSGAMIPGWIMNIPANKILRLSWRFFMQTIMVIPFALYQYRTSNEEMKKKYNLAYIFNPTNIIKPLVSSLATCFWLSMITFGFQWTSVSHSIIMGSLSNFFLSLDRSRRQCSHDLELGGQILVCFGVVMVVIDTWRFSSEQLSPHDLSVNNTFYFSRTFWERITFDLSAFTMSFFVSKFSQYTSDLKNYYPPFLSMFLVNTFNCVHMGFSSFFINGCSFDFHPFFGIWSLFTNKHFAGFMYMAIVLSLGQLISLVLVTRMFPDPIIPALAMTLEPFIATFIIDIVNIQRLPGTLTVMAYVFFVPGLCLILVGQCLYQRITSKKVEDEKRAASLLQQLREIKQRREERKQKMQLKSRNTRLGFRSISDEPEGFTSK